jgi:catechol 2,3-dioxygenase-like lactoylglutathione lyase family enzyme
MNNTYLSHIELKIAPQHMGFYQDLFRFLGWSTIYSDENTFGTGDANGTSLWFSQPAKDTANDYDGPGINHLGISVKHQADVDEALLYLNQHGLAALFETPRHRAEFSRPGETYYQVMFESPDRILFEIVYAGPASCSQPVTREFCRARPFYSTVGPAG